MVIAAEDRFFFKVLLPGFHRRLSLPRAFCDKLEEEDEPEGAILEIRKKGKWKIGTCRDSEGVISFEDGWPEFARSHSLSVGDFVVFEHTGEFHFNVLVFGPNACEKELPNACRKEVPEACEKELPVGSERGATVAGIPNCLYGKIRRKSEKKSGVSYHSEDPYFVVTITPHLATYKAELITPKEFVASNDLGRKTWASLRDPAGEVWVGKFHVQYDPFRCRMRRGWSDFCVSNELKDGDVCVFVLDRSSRTSPITVSFDVKIFRASASVPCPSDPNS